MSSDSFFVIAFTSILSLLFGSVLAFMGYRFFLVLLPIWGFFYGFGLGAQSIQALFGDAFLSTVTSWVVGFVLAVAFALVSYFFYIAAVGLIALSLGYWAGVGLMQAIGLDFGLIPWLVGVALGIVMVVITFAFNIQKYVIIGATALLGAGVIVGTFLFLFGGVPQAALVGSAVRQVIQTSPFWLLVFIVVAAFGAITQYQANRNWEIETYDRWTQPAAPTPTPPREPSPPEVAATTADGPTT